MLRPQTCFASGSRLLAATESRLSSRSASIVLSQRVALSGPTLTGQIVRGLAIELDLRNRERALEVVQPQEAALAVN